MEKRVIIVGAGIAGLSAGIYARKCGFDTTIIESHSIPGGLCTSWKRKGYLFEGAIHWLAGSSPKHPYNVLWRETGALNDDIRIYNSDPYLYTRHGGTDLYLYRDINRLREHFMQVSPADAREIKKLCAHAMRYSRLNIPVENEKGVRMSQKEPAMTLRDIREIISMIPAMASMGKHMKISIEDYVERFQHEGIRQLLLSACPQNFPLFALLFVLATMHNGDGGYPEGGSLALVQRMANKFKSLGGNLVLNTKVRKVIVEDGKVKGVAAGEKTFDADCVILANDTLKAVDTLFDFPIRDEWVETLKTDVKATACTFAGIGVKADLSDLPHGIVIHLDEPFELAGEKLPFVRFYNYGGYESYAPEGCSVLTAILGENDRYEWWRRSKENGTYYEEKEKIKKRLTEILAAHLPATRGNIEVVDVATPLTFERYAGTWHGSYMSRMEAGSKMKKYPCTLSGVSGLFFAGQRVNFPGGLFQALHSGRRTVQLLCKHYDVVFQGNKA